MTNIVCTSCLQAEQTGQEWALQQLLLAKNAFCKYFEQRYFNEEYQRLTVINEALLTLLSTKNVRNRSHPDAKYRLLLLPEI